MSVIILLIADLLIISTVALAVYARPKRKIWRIVCLLPVTALIAGIAFIAGAIWNTRPTAQEEAQYALNKTGLSFNEIGSFSLHGSTGWRDFFDMTVFRVPYDGERQQLMDEIGVTEGWRVADVTYPEYSDFSNSALWGDHDIIMLPKETVFEAWYYCETSEPHDTYAHTCTGAFEDIGSLGRGFDFAVYDADTGLFIFFHQFG